MKRRKKRDTQVSERKFLLAMLAVAVAVSGLMFYIFLHRSAAQANRGTPHYFSTADAARPLPQTLDPAAFSSREIAAAYQTAKDIPEVLAQQPCYCYCDRRKGHRSLLDCFASRHAADCDICLKEALFAMQEHRKGKSTEQIRSQIIQGGWKTIQLQS